MILVMQKLVHPPKAKPGDRIAVVSPSFAAAGAFPAVHEQAMMRLAEVTGLVPVEYPTTRQLDASPEARASDINAAFAHPEVRAILAVVGGEDQIRVIPHLDVELARNDPKPFLGISDNTNLHNWLWMNGIASFYGGSSQVHLGPGPHVDPIHAASLRAALITGESLELVEPGESEDVGVRWDDPRALTSFGERDATEPMDLERPATSRHGTIVGRVRRSDRMDAHRRAASHLTGRAGWRGAAARDIRGTSARSQCRVDSAFTRRAGDLECGRRCPTCSSSCLRLHPPGRPERAQLRRDQAAVITEVVSTYNAQAVVCVGVPFGHTRPQWIIPHGGEITVDGTRKRVFADYS